MKASLQRLKGHCLAPYFDGLCCLTRNSMALVGPGWGAQTAQPNRKIIRNYSAPAPRSFRPLSRWQQEVIRAGSRNLWTLELPHDGRELESTFSTFPHFLIQTDFWKSGKSSDGKEFFFRLTLLGYNINNGIIRLCICKYIYIYSILVSTYLVSILPTLLRLMGWGVVSGLITNQHTRHQHPNSEPQRIRRSTPGRVWYWNMGWETRWDWIYLYMVFIYIYIYLGITEVYQWSKCVKSNTFGDVKLQEAAVATVATTSALYILPLEQDYAAAPQSQCQSWQRTCGCSWQQRILREMGEGDNSINHHQPWFKSWLPSDATRFPWAPAPKDLDRSIHMRKNRDPIEGQSLGLIIQGPSYQLTIISHVNKNKVSRPHQACSLSSPSSGAAWHQWTSSTAACSWRLRD